MPAAKTLSTSQDFPLIFRPSPRRDGTWGSLLGDCALQEITAAGLSPESDLAGGRIAFRGFAEAAAVRRHTVNGAERSQSEFKWLAENRQQYAGRWVALDGDTLLAVGDSAREVYAAISNHEGIPLVTRVEPAEEIYFAGWQNLATTLTFRYTHDYSAQSGDGITIPIQLGAGPKAVRLHAKLDTGASFCIFQRDFGEQLGLDIEGGDQRTFHTANGEFKAFGHEVTITCFEWQFDSMVYFPALPAIGRNVLGRHGWLQQFSLAVIDYKSLLHLSHFNQE